LKVEEKINGGNMNTFLVSYDLGIPETSEDYKKLIDLLKSSDHWAHVLQSVWIVKTDRLASDLLVEMKRLSDENDRIIIIDLSNNNVTSYGLPEEVEDWIDESL
jgi:hypothetical protein